MKSSKSQLTLAQINIKVSHIRKVCFGLGGKRLFEHVRKAYLLLCYCPLCFRLQLLRIKVQSSFPVRPLLSYPIFVSLHRTRLFGVADLIEVLGKYIKQLFSVEKYFKFHVFVHRHLLSTFHLMEFLMDLRFNTTLLFTPFLSLMVHSFILA